MTKETSCELEIKFVDCTTASQCCAVLARKGCPSLSKNCACASSQNLDMAFLINKRNKLTVWSSLLTARETAARAGGAHFEPRKASFLLLPAVQVYAPQTGFRSSQQFKHLQAKISIHYWYGRNIWIFSRFEIRDWNNYLEYKYYQTHIGFKTILEMSYNKTPIFCNLKISWI